MMGYASGTGLLRCCMPSGLPTSFTRPAPDRSRRWTRGFVVSGGDPLALASIHHHFTDGSSVELETALEVDYPDALAECVARVRDLYREVVPDGEDVEPET